MLISSKHQRLEIMNRILIQVLATIVLVQTTANRVSSAIYDPELQDGIPIFSARSSTIEQQSSLSPSPASASSSPRTITTDWSSISDDEPMQRPVAATQRRRDSLEEDDEDDEDNYPSGSSARESVENPAYGESQRAARDGDEIENFFDKHLGQPQNEASAAAAAAAASDESRPIARVAEMIPAKDPDDGGGSGHNNGGDDDDDQEAAASSPIASFLHNLIFHSDDHSASQLAKNSSNIVNGGAVGGGGKRITPFIIHAFGSSGNHKELAKMPEKSQMLASPSSIVHYEPQATGAAAGTAAAAAEEEELRSANANPTAQDVGGGIQEIYIGRRPTVMSYLQQAQAQAQQQQQQQLMHSSSSEEQQYLPQQQQYQQLAYYHPHTAATGSANNIWQMPMSNHQLQAAGYQQIPVAASYAYGQSQHYPMDSSAATNGNTEEAPADNGDEQTVTYGLSFGSRGHTSTSGGGDDSIDDTHQQVAAGQDEHNQNQEQTMMMNPMMMRAQQQHYQQQVAAAGQVPYSARFAGAMPSQRQQYYGNSNYQQQLTPAQRQYLMDQHQQQQQQQQRLRYQQLRQQQQQQRDEPSDSETMSRAAAYQHHQMNHLNNPNSGSQSKYSLPNHSNAKMQLDRQQLLANLNKELRSSPMYASRRKAVRGGSNNRAAEESNQNSQVVADKDKDQLAATAKHNGRREPLTAFNSVRKSYLGDDLSSFNALHIEVDPYKSLTTSARLIPTTTKTTTATTEQSKAELQSLDNNGTPTGGDSGSAHANNKNSNLHIGPLTKFDRSHEKLIGDSLRNGNRGANNEELSGSGGGGNLRVRRDDSDDRDDADDDGVWVDDDDDDDNKQQSSDLNETTQEPEEDEGEEGETEADDQDGQQQQQQQQQQDGTNFNGQQVAANRLHNQAPAMIGRPHGYELSPNDLMIYNG